jgi:hypothetical protein
VRRLGALVSFAVLLAGAGFLAGGCGTPVDVMAPDLDTMMNEHHLQYETQDLTAQALEDRIKEIDGYYAEPRSFGKLLTSYETCLKSISAVNDYAALWRGARACAAIALDRNEVRSRRMEYAGKGIGLAREAMRKTSHRVEPYYYHALCLSAVADLRQDATRDQLRRMRDDMMLAKSIGEPPGARPGLRRRKRDRPGPRRDREGARVAASEGSHSRAPGLARGSDDADDEPAGKVTPGPIRGASSA